MLTEYKLIPVAGEPTIHSIDLPPEPTYDRLSVLLRPLLGGNYIERVRVWHTHKYLDMFVDDNGSRKGLPLNPIATIIYRANAIQHEHPTPKADDLPAIYGTAVLFYRPVWF